MELENWEGVFWFDATTRRRMEEAASEIREAWLKAALGLP